MLFGVLGKVKQVNINYDVFPSDHKNDYKYFANIDNMHKYFSNHLEILKGNRELCWFLLHKKQNKNNVNFTTCPVTKEGKKWQFCSFHGVTVTAWNTAVNTRCK